MMKIKKNIVIMYAIAFLQGMVFYGAITTLYRQAVGVSVFQITIIESISLALALALELPWGIFAEKIGYKNTMIVCNVLYFISKIIFWQADGFGMFLLERVLLSVVLAGLSGVDSSVLFLSSEEDYAQKAFSIYDSLGTAGMLFAAAIYTVLIHGNYRMAGLLTAISYGVAMICTFFLTEVKPAEAQETAPLKEFVVILKDTFHKKDLFLLLIGAALFSESHQTITVFLNQLQYVRAGMNDSMIGVAYIVITIAGLSGVWSVRFTEKCGKRQTGAILTGGGAVICLVLAITTNPWISIVAIILLRIAFVLFMPLFDVIQNQQVTHQNRATALSIHSVIMDGVAIGTNLILGKASDLNLPLAFGIGAGFCLVGFILYLYATRNMIRIAE